MARDRRAEDAPAGAEHLLVLLLCGAGLGGCLAPADPPADLGARGGELADAGGGEPDLTPEVGIPDDLGGPPDGSADLARPDLRCADPLEPNDTPATAYLLRSGEWSGLTICPGDVDYYLLELRPGEPFRIQALFDGSQGDLDLLLQEPDGGRSWRFEQTGDDELAAGVAARQGRYLLQVAGFRSATNRYTLRVRLGDDCPADGREPDDEPAQAVPYPAGELAGTRCPADDDWVAVPLAPGEQLFALLDFAPATEELDLRLHVRTATGAPQPLEIAPTVGEGRRSLGYGPVAQAVTVLVQVSGPPAVWAEYLLRLHRLPATSLLEVSARGAVTRDDFVLSRAGFAPATVVPAAGVEVELVREVDEQVLARAVTDATGEFDLAATVWPGFALYVRALARGHEQGAWIQVVAPEAPGRLHAWRGAATSPEELAPTLRLHVPAAELAGAFNIVAAVQAAYRRLAAFVPLEATPELTVRWEPGVGFACGSCYAAREISLGGTLEDPDEFDDAVIHHEVGHFLAAVWSRDDSLGGGHEGEYADPRLAWSEGWATFHAALQQDSALYLDYRLTGLFARDLETLDLPASYGTADGTAPGKVSELLVGAVLWDLYDAPVPDDDPVPGSDRLLEPVFGYLASRDRQEAGVFGVDLQDYLDGYVCHEVGSLALLEELLQGRNYPYRPEAAPMGCRFVPPTSATPLPRAPRGKPQAPLLLRLERQTLAAGHLVVTAQAAVPALEVQVLGRRVRPLRGLAAGESTRIALVAPPGWPLVVGVTATYPDGTRLHAVPSPAADLEAALRALVQQRASLLRERLPVARISPARPARDGRGRPIGLRGGP